MFWILFVIAFALFIHYIVIKPFNYWKEKNVPQYSLWEIWKETILAFMQHRTVLDGLMKLYSDFSGHRYFGGYQFLKPIFIVRDPELTIQLTVKDFDYFMDHSQFLPDDSNVLFQKNLALLKGDKWRDMRSTLSPTFTGSKMKMMFGLMSNCAKQFVKYFSEHDEEADEVETKEVFSRFANDVIASTAFGVECDSLQDKENEFFMMGKRVSGGDGGNLLQNVKYILFFIIPKVMKALGISLFDEQVNNFFRRIVKQNIQEREERNIVRMDMIHLLMESRKERSKNKEREQLTDEDVTAQAMVFFMAGFDSVASSMSFMSYELAIHPDVQKKLQDEIDETLNNCGGELTYEALMKMKYMDMVVSETLRKWTAGIATDRMCVKPYTIQPVNDNEAPVHLNPGDTIVMLTCGLHLDSDFFPEPQRFDPERFSDENKDLINSHTYMPFGIGPRICIGNRFALMEMKLLFVYLLSKFDIAVTGKTQLPLELSKSQFQLAAKDGIWLGFKPRRTLQGLC